MTEPDEKELDHASLVNNWDRDQPVLTQINKDLYARFGPSPNATAEEYTAELRKAVAAQNANLYRVTVRVMARISDDVDALLKDVPSPKWTQASHFVSSFTEFTTFAFKQ